MKISFKSKITLLIFLAFTLIFLVKKLKKTTSHEGVIINAETGEPIAHAKVVLTTWPYALMDANATHIGTITDKDGNFSISSSPGYWINHVYLSAASQDGYFAQETKPGKFTILELKELKDSRSSLEEYNYSNFSGGWIGDVKWIK